MPADNEPSTADTSEAGTVETRREPGERAKAAVAALRTAEQRPGGSKPDPILVADNVVRTFGGLTAVDVEHVEDQRGANPALIGPHGAGQTTFFHLLTGFDKPGNGLGEFNTEESRGGTEW